ncbi:ankyrin-1-like [Haliotis rubra]|uniref:ankyrin-1-like n=1 Tax=Haliotis rubra TaxID=36100 RepID=UPI001EE564D7|nr:ankyrin-1-like [Haliotis rubra]
MADDIFQYDIYEEAICEDTLSRSIQAALDSDNPKLLDICIDSTDEDIPEQLHLVLLEACTKGAANILLFILKELGVNQIEHLKNNRSYLLGAAIINGHGEVVKILLDAGIDRTDLTGHGDSDVILAIRYKKPEILKILLEAGVQNVNISNSYGVFPLYMAIKQKQVGCLKQLIAAGADVNKKIERESVNQDNPQPSDNDVQTKATTGDSLVHILLRKLGLRVFTEKVSEYFIYDNMFEIFLNLDVDLSVVNSYGHSVVDEAVVSLCDAKFMRRLVDKGCQLRLSNPYHYACFDDSVERLEVIQKLGFDVNTFTPETPFSPLFIACWGQNMKIVKWLLENGAKPTVYVDSKMLCAWIARVNKCVDAFFEDQDGFITKVSKMTPLHFMLMGSLSVFMSAQPVVETLCEHGADVNSQTLTGETPLLYFTRDLLGEDNFPIIPTSFEALGPEESLFVSLIQAGANPDTGSGREVYPLTYCIPEKLSRIALMFLEVSVNLSHYVATDDTQVKAFCLSDLSFLPLNKDSLQSLVQNPRKLRVLCRKVILQASSGRLIKGENSLLELPQKVRNYVMLKYLREPDWYDNPYTLM